MKMLKHFSRMKNDTIVVFMEENVQEFYEVNFFLKWS